MINEPITSILAVAIIVLLLVVLIAAWNALEDLVPSVKKTIYKFCWGEPIEPYRIGRMPRTGGTILSCLMELNCLNKCIYFNLQPE